tara:strand:- start:1609 stop:1755 length:147 start_codon:yes stop_codon:yes gene_type:complete
MEVAFGGLVVLIVSAIWTRLEMLMKRLNKFEVRLETHIREFKKANREG